MEDSTSAQALLKDKEVEFSNFPHVSAVADGDSKVRGERVTIGAFTAPEAQLGP